MKNDFTVTGITYHFDQRNSTKRDLAGKNLIEAISTGHSIAKIVRNSSVLKNIIKFLSLFIRR